MVRANTNGGLIMRLSIKIVSTLVATAAISLFIWSSTGPTQAQSNCTSFDALGQLIIPTTNPLAVGHRWGGQVYIKMGDEYLQGLISGDDGTVVRQPNTGHGKDGLYIIGFDCVPGTPTWMCADTINIEVPNSIFGPGAPIYDQYQGNSAYFNGGTGRFEFVTGQTTFRGPYIVWNTGGMPPRTGRFNPEMNGQICGVEPD
jgi:hypothetical protein